MGGVLGQRRDNFSRFYAGLADRRPRPWAWLRSWFGARSDRKGQRQTPPLPPAPSGAAGSAGSAG
jgi:hypothetical protein